MMMGQNWLGRTKHSGWSEKPLTSFKYFSFNGIFYWLTNCLPAWCLQTSVIRKWLRLSVFCFSLFDITLAERCLLAYRIMYNAFLPEPSFVFHSSLLTVKIVDLVVARDGFLFVTPYFSTGYFDAFKMLLDSYWLVMGWTESATNHNGYFTFQMIIDILRYTML